MNTYSFNTIRARHKIVVCHSVERLCYYSLKYFVYHKFDILWSRSLNLYVDIVLTEKQIIDLLVVRFLVKYLIITNITKNKTIYEKQIILKSERNGGSIMKNP